MDIAEASKYFGMSRDVILSCIKCGKIEGAVQDKNGEWDIPETAIYHGTCGKYVTVKAIVEETKERIKSSMAPAEEQIKVLEEDISYFTAKYGDYNTLANKANKTYLEETHFREWRYVIRRIEEYKREIESHKGQKVQ